MRLDPPRDWVPLKDVPVPKYPPFVIDAVLHDVNTVMYGRPEAGKSYLALSFASCLITGEPWFGQPVREKRRVAFLMLDPGQVAQTRERGAHMPGLDAMLVSSLKPGSEEQQWALAGDRLAYLGADFLIIDSLSRLLPSGASARDDAAVEAVLRNISVMERYGIGVLLLHHAGKPGEDGNPKTTPLGATVIESWARHLIRVEYAIDRKTRRPSRKALSYGNDLKAGETSYPFSIEEGRVSECRNVSLDQHRLQAMIAGQPWKSQRHIGQGIGISQPQVQRVLKRSGYYLDHDTGRIEPEPWPEAEAA